VDDAIVDLENIHRHIDMGKTPWRAAFEATAEIGLAVVATTMTIVVVFLPVSFMGGIPGMFFRSFGISVAVSVLFSLVVARTLTPLLAAYMLPAHKGAIEHKEPFYRNFYMKCLRWSLKHRWAVLAGAVVIFFASLTLVPLLPKGFISNGDTGAVTVTIALPSGVGINETDRVVQEATRVVKKHSDVLSVYATIGSGSGGGMEAMRGGGAGGVSSGKLYVSLKPRHERHTTLDAFVETVAPELRKIPGARISVVKAGAAGPGGKPVMVILRGGDGNSLEETATRVLAEMRAMPGLVDVTSTSAEMRPELQIKPDPARAAEQGVLVATIGRAARVATQGDSDINLPKFNAGDEQINIRVQLTDEVKLDMAAIGNLMLPARGGNMVPLRSVADVTLGSGPVQISRYDRARQVTLDANLGAGATLGTAMEKITQLPSMRALPPGVEQGSLGQAKIMADIFAGFGRALGMGVILIYAVLVLLFRGFLQPLTIMGALPLAIGGAFLGLLLGGKELGMMGLIGVIMLMGLVTKNSILLVEYALQAREKGMSRHEAILLAGHDRLRPIIMTTIAMIAGMLPIAMSIGEGTERLSPMAAAVVGGLITSTALTLIVIPVAYTLVDDVAEFFRKRLSFLWKRNAENENEAFEPAAGPVPVHRSEP
jgi:multidrug efflux pump subunit AcrB